MKVGLDSYSYRYAAGLWGWQPPRGLDPEGYLRRGQELRLAGLHFADLRHLESLADAYLLSLRRKAEKAGLYLELGTGGTEPAHLEKALRVAAVLGSPVLRTFVGAFRWQAQTTGPALVEQAAHDLGRIVPLAEQVGVRVAIENHLDLLTDELVALLRTVASDQVGVCLDTGNSLGLLEDPLVAAEALAPYTFTTHLKEFRVTLRREGLVLRGAPLAQGDVPNLEIVAILRRQGPLGEALPLNIETALERVTVPIFQESFLASLTGLTARRVVALLARLDLDHPADDDQLALPDERGATPEEILAAEHAQVAESAAWALAHFA